MISYENQLTGKDDNYNTLIISSMTSLTMPSTDITGDCRFGTILESKVCVSAANTSIEKLSKLETSMTNRQPGKTILTSQRKNGGRTYTCKEMEHPNRQSQNNSPCYNPTRCATCDKSLNHEDIPDQ